MPEDDHILAIVREWVDKAESDLKVAAHTLKLGKACPADMVCFHAQQCVEKYLKALLTLRKIDFPKTHDIAELIAFLPARSRPVLAVDEQRRLTSYATVTRYPGHYEPIEPIEARRAVALARRVRREVRRLLPRKALG
jgi:HEPN domain-containing protein